MSGKDSSSTGSNAAPDPLTVSGGIVEPVVGSLSSSDMEAIAEEILKKMKEKGSSGASSSSCKLHAPAHSHHSHTYKHAH